MPPEGTCLPIPTSNRLVNILDATLDPVCVDKVQDEKVRDAPFGVGSYGAGTLLFPNRTRKVHWTPNIRKCVTVIKFRVLRFKDTIGTPKSVSPNELLDPPLASLVESQNVHVCWKSSLNSLMMHVLRCPFNDTVLHVDKAGNEPQYEKTLLAVKTSLRTVSSCLPLQTIYALL